MSEAGSIVAQYVYDPYGSVVETYGSMPTAFSFGFSTKYHDREVGMVGYQRRFYRPSLGRWLNRDPIEEEGGENLYAFCSNCPSLYVDVNGEVMLFDTLVATAIGGVIGGVAAALTVGDVVAGIAGGAVSGACMSICPWASVQCGALGGAVSGFISGVKGANKKDLCGAKWHAHVVGSVAIGTVTGGVFGRLGDGIDSLVGSWTKTITASSLTLTIEVNGPNIATSFSGGVSSSAAELILLSIPEEATSAVHRLGDKMSEEYEEINVEFDASGTIR